MCYHLITMSKEERKARREKRIQIIEENRLFRKRIDALFAKKYRYSLRYEENTVMEDGKAYINVDLSKIKTPFSDFSYDRRINPEIYDYIDNEVFYLRASIPVVINFDDKGKYSDELKEKIKKAVIRHYSLQYEDCRLEYKRSIFSGALILILGILFLAAYISLSLTVLKNIDRIIIEIVCILSWVFIWESVDHFLFSGHERRIDVYNAGQLALCEVRFGAPIRKTEEKKK